MSGLDHGNSPLLRNDLWDSHGIYQPLCDHLAVAWNTQHPMRVRAPLIRPNENFRRAVRMIGGVTRPSQQSGGIVPQIFWAKPNHALSLNGVGKNFFSHAEISARVCGASSSDKGKCDTPVGIINSALAPAF